MTIRNYRCFNSRTPRGVRHRLSARRTLPKRFNARTPRGVRQAELPLVPIYFVFQFTHPAWSATSSLQSSFPCMGGFNSRTPRGVRLKFLTTDQQRQLFQFTHPAWGATAPKNVAEIDNIEVSIHAPRVGCDALARC